MASVTDLPPEIISAIINETVHIWPHRLWDKPGKNEFRTLEDEYVTEPWLDGHECLDSRYCPLLSCRAMSKIHIVIISLSAERTLARQVI